MFKYDENVFFITDFDDSMESEIIIPMYRQIQKQSRKKNGVIDVLVSSFGGYRHLALQIVSLLEIAKREGIIVRTLVSSVAYSAGSMVAVAGSPGERYIEKGAEHLVHYGTAGSVESTPEQIERVYIQKNAGFKAMRAHYEKYCNIENLEQLMNDDMGFIPANKCIKWGLADKYADKFDIDAYRD